MKRNHLRDIERTEYVSNIILAYLDASPEQKQNGRLWYPTAHALALGLAHEFGYTIEQTAGVIAVLSPQISWERNCILAYAVCAGQDVTGVLRNNVQKALRILAGEPISENVRGCKVKTFYDCILTGGKSTSICIDHHALAVALGRDATPLEAQAIGRANIYNLFVDAYNEAAKHLGKLPSEVQAITWVYWRERTGD